MAAVRVSALSIFEHLLSCGISDFVSVPDTHQKTLIDLLLNQSDMRFIQVCTEDEAVGVATGLYAGGRNPALLIQNAGFYACLNSIRGLSLDAEIPTFMLIGEYMRQSTNSSIEDPSRVVNLTEPTLDTWKIPYWRLESSDDIGNIRLAYDHAFSQKGPSALLIGAPTA